MRLFLSFLLILVLNACAGPQLRGTGDLGLIIERASGNVTLVNTTSRQPYARIGGLGDLSHASVVYSRDGRYAFIFGRDGGLTKLDLLEAKIVKRVIQSGNAIGCFPKCRLNMRRGNFPRSLGWPMCRVTNSPTPCLMAAKSGSAISATRNIR